MVGPPRIERAMERRFVVELSIAAIDGHGSAVRLLCLPSSRSACGLAWNSKSDGRMMSPGSGAHHRAANGIWPTEQFVRA